MIVVPDKIILLYGLPGSGKTRWARRNGCGEDVQVLDFDSPDPFKNFKQEQHVYICDGLFLCNSDVISLISKFTSRLGIWFADILEIHYWRKDREACLWNDKLRNKERSAEVTIKNANLEPPDEKYLRESISVDTIKDIRVIEENVVNVGQGLLEKMDDLNYICSDETWIAGGDVYNYRGERERLDPEEPPKFFKELEDILDDFSPEITRTDYKKILEKVEIDTKSVSDYYGGQEIQGFYKVNLRNVLDILYKSGYFYDPEEK